MMHRESGPARFLRNKNLFMVISGVKLVKILFCVELMYTHFSTMWLPWIPLE